MALGDGLALLPRTDGGEAARPGRNRRAPARRRREAREGSRTATASGDGLSASGPSVIARDDEPGGLGIVRLAPGKASVYDISEEGEERGGHGALDFGLVALLGTAWRAPPKALSEKRRVWAARRSTGTGTAKFILSGVFSALLDRRARRRRGWGKVNKCGNDWNICRLMG